MKPVEGVARHPLGEAQRLTLQAGGQRLRLLRRTRPRWASAMGRDRFGLWAEIAPAGLESPLRQRLRWIPPGRFQMGSPEGEPGRYDDEGPQHPVTLERGYWLFDTPVTQALWQAMMGENRSRFQSENRPVESIDWDDCHRFCDAINARIPELELTLPSEAQWEYACRAGTRSAVYTGELEIIGDGNAPDLHPIAWYGGNSGEAFDLKNGRTIDHLENRQFSSNPCGTHPVKGKQPNPWGFYDMLGNVWEWTEDEWHDDYSGEGRPDNGRAWIDERKTTESEAGAGRVVRGGSWDFKARDCRAACRLGYLPGVRNDILGFRPARVQA